MAASMAEEKPASGPCQEEQVEPDFAEMLTEGVRELFGAFPETARTWRNSIRDPPNDPFQWWLAESLARRGRRE